MNCIQGCWLAFILIFTPSQGYPWDDNRIVGGQNAAAGEFPYMVALLRDGNFGCGGAIITRRTVITAAHCVAKSDPNKIIILAGTTKLDRGGVRYHAKKIIIHPLYNSTNTRNDVALIILSQNIAFNRFIKAYPISTTTTRSNVPVTLSGWGDTSNPNGDTPNDLQKINLKTISRSECKETFSNYDNQICTFTKVGQGACFGDSGSPLVDGNAIVGLASFVIPCAQGYPDAFTRVSVYAPWINENKR